MLIGNREVKDFCFALSGAVNEIYSLHGVCFCAPLNGGGSNSCAREFHMHIDWFV
jgi:hypothetical protein